MNSLVSQLQASALTRFLSGDAYAFPVLEIVHVLTIGLVLGSLFIIDLRLTGLGWRRWQARGILEDLVPVALWSFVGAALSGALLFASQPEAYLAAWPFQFKLVLLVLAGLNAAFFHRFLARRLPAGDAGVEPAPPLPVRISGGLSLLLWGLILIAARFIGFVVVH
jgi:hypothetical protein